MNNGTQNTDTMLFLAALLHLHKQRFDKWLYGGLMTLEYAALLYLKESATYKATLLYVPGRWGTHSAGK